MSSEDDASKDDAGPDRIGRPPDQRQRPATPSALPAPAPRLALPAPSPGEERPSGPALAAGLAARLGGSARAPAGAAEASARKVELGRQFEELRRRRATPGDWPARPPAPALRPKAPPSRPAPPVDLADLTAGQRDCLECLTEAQRAVFEALPAERKVMILGPHAAGYDPVIGREWARKLTPREAARPLPETTEELIDRIPGAERTWSIKLATAFREDFGEAKDGRLWGQFEHIAEAVRRGRLAPGPVLKAYRDAMGPKAQNRGALFWFTLQREAGISGSSLASLASGP